MTKINHADVKFYQELGRKEVIVLQVNYHTFNLIEFYAVPVEADLDIFSDMAAIFRVKLKH
jgi:hypothetical protein